MVRTQEPLEGTKKHRLRRLGVVAFALVAVAIFGSLPASAITSGQPDGSGHPYVGVLVDDYETPGYFQRFCSGTLVAPRLVVTAAHCLVAMVDDQVWLSFDPIYQPGVSTLIHGTGYAAVDPTNFHGANGAGTQYGHSDLANDIAVVHLDSPAPVTTFGELPTAGKLSTLNLKDAAFTAVGYGRTRVDKTNGPNNIESNFDPDYRNVATVGFRNLLNAVVDTDENPARGYGGGCYGDSGGPLFLGNVMVAISITGDTTCRAAGRYYRLDTPFARQFLASQGVTLP